LERFYEPWQGKSKEEKVIYISNPTWGEWLKNNCVFSSVD